LIDESLESGQCLEAITSLLCSLVIKFKINTSDILIWIENNLSESILFELRTLNSILYLGDHVDTISYRIVHQINWEKVDFKTFIKYSLHPKKYSIKLTVILVLIKEFGLSKEDIEKLSVEMANSGRIFDYRDSNNLSDKLLLRRYPTGGVSEKTALIMPSLLKSLSHKFKIASPFLVAKTLSFTGGTWDKLSCIPGFKFPFAGEESLRMLEKGSVCMTVTNGEYNPSDKFLYQLRSITNTVNSLPLIVSSIASKQLANPVNNLLLDIRYGENTFLKTKSKALDFFKLTKSILEKYHIHTIAEYTDSSLINGSSIGNYLEVLESISLMKNQTEYSLYNFNEERIEFQRHLVIKFTSKILASCFDFSKEEIEGICEEQFKRGEVFKSFIELLKNHGVSHDTIENIIHDKEFSRINGTFSYPVMSKRAGTIHSIRTKNIGEYVNFQLKAGTNVFNNTKNYYNGFLIEKHIGQTVKKGDRLATIISQKTISNWELTNSFFEIY